MAELSVRTRRVRKAQERKINLLINIENQAPYKVKFLTKDKVKKVVGIKCNKERYHENYLFKPNEPYILSISSNFIGEILIDCVNGQELSYPILEKGTETATIAILKPPTNTQRTASNRHHHVINKEELKEELNCAIEIGNKYFDGFDDGKNIITDDNKYWFIEFFKNSTARSILEGAVADISQEAYNWSEINNKIKGSKFSIVTQANGRRYIKFQNFRKLKRVLTASKYKLTHTRIQNLGIIPTTKNMLTWSNLKGGTIVTVIVGSVIGTIDYFLTKDENAKTDLSDLLIGLGTGIVKGVAAYMAGTAITAGLFSAAVTTAAIFGSVITAPVWGIFAVGVIISIGIGALFNGLDSKYGITDSFKEWFNELQETFAKKIQEMEDSWDRAIYRFFSDFEREFWNWVASQGGTTPYSYNYRW